MAHNASRAPVRWLLAGRDCIGVILPSEAAYKELGPSRDPD